MCSYRCVTIIGVFQLVRSKSMANLDTVTYLIGLDNDINNCNSATDLVPSNNKNTRICTLYLLDKDICPVSKTMPTEEVIFG